MIPSGLELLVLVLAAYRITRLVGWDDFPLAARARAWATGEGSDGTFERPVLEHFLTCPFCIGFWISLAVYGAWLSAPTPTLYAMTPFAISASVGLIAKNLDP